MTQAPTPKISIVTVSYNQSEYLEDNILSIINQKYPNIEHIVVDGGSTDGSVEVLKKYDDYITWTSEPDDGQSDALNKGFKKATGEIIGWINSDDRLHFGALKIVSEYFSKNEDVLAIVGDLLLIDEAGNEIKKVISKTYTNNYLVNIARGITQQSIFFKRSVFNDIGYIDTKLNYVMDRDFFIRVSTLANIEYIPETLAHFRLQSNSKTSEGSQNFCRELIKLRRKYGGKLLSSGIRHDLYIILTAPLKKYKFARDLANKIRG